MYFLPSVALCAVIAQCAADSIVVSITTSTLLNEVDERFINFNIDTGSIFNGLNFSDSKLRTLSAQLALPSGSLLRVGGTAVDYSYYYPEIPYVIGAINGNAAGDTSFGTELLDALVSYTNATGLELLYDFNGRSTRNASGAWDPWINATAIMNYLQSRYAGTKVSWSLGNEPGVWQPPFNVSDAQLAADAVTLKTLVTGVNYSLGTDVYGSSFQSISNIDARAYLPGAKAAITGLTMHCYPYPNGGNCNLATYLNKTHVTDYMASSLESVTRVASNMTLRPGTLLVLEETAGSSGGGCENITDRFAGGFAWLPIINAVAYSGWQRLHRQDIVGWSFAFGKSHYQLVGSPGWTNGTAASINPHPDWFTTILAKQLLGRGVLATSAAGSLELTAAFDVHAWCARGAGAGAIAVSWVNLGGADVTVSLGAPLDGQARVEYTLTSSAASYTQARPGRSPVDAPPPGSIQDDNAFLNGELLYVDPESGALPAYPIQGKPVTAGAGPLLAPAYAYGFAVYPSAGAPACTGSS